MNLNGTASGKENAQGAAPFNELVDPQGRLRPAYRRFQERTGFHPFSLPSTQVQNLLRTPFADRMQICPVPLILDESDAQTIRSGARQRAKALQLFFHDMVVGSQSILRSGTVAPEDILTVFNDEGMGLTELRRIWQGKPVSAVRFLYGPDLNRTPSGNWVVTEDNVGRIGGTPEALGAIRSFAQATGASPSDHQNYRDDIEVMVQLFVESLGLKISDPGVVALVPYDPSPSGFELIDLSSTRRKGILERMGLACWDMNHLTPEQKAAALEGRIKAFVNFDVRAWRPKREFSEEIFMKRAIPLLEAPGVKIIGNKGFLPFVEDIIRFYLREEPILRTQPTTLLREPSLPENPERWVLKIASSSVGAGVFILRYLSATQKEAVVQRLREEWKAKVEQGHGGTVVQQEYLTPSYLPLSESNTWANFLVEVRPITAVYGDDQIHVFENLHAKATSSLGDPRNNVGLGAFIGIVIREDVQPQSRASNSEEDPS